jgi:hypothetical protein
MNNFEPYITVVVTARNDNHGGNMLRRMQAFLNAWFGQAARYDLPSEVIVVEWNPPADRPKLIDCLELPNDTGPCELRFVDVSGEVHRRFPNPEAIPLHQMAAKNAGIRRARGKFVLATNLDIVFSGELMRFLAERRLVGRIAGLLPPKHAACIHRGRPIRVCFRRNAESRKSGHRRSLRGPSVRLGLVSRGALR